MRTKTTKKIALILLTMILAFSFAACASVDPSDTGSDVETITVKMNIDYSEYKVKDKAEDADAKEIRKPENVKNYKMQVENSATVLQILQSYAAQEDIEVLVDDASTLYVTSIDGVSDSSSSGWVYEINGEATTSGSSEYVPEDGDEILWKYINF